MPSKCNHPQAKGVRCTGNCALYMSVYQSALERGQVDADGNVRLGLSDFSVKVFLSDLDIDTQDTVQ